MLIEICKNLWIDLEKIVVIKKVNEETTEGDQFAYYVAMSTGANFHLIAPYAEKVIEKLKILRVPQEFCNPRKVFNSTPPE